MDANEYNSARIASGVIKPADIAALVSYFQRGEKLDPVDGCLGPNTLAKLRPTPTVELYHGKKTEDTAVLPPAGMLDRRQHALKTYDFGPRPLAKVTGICLHQTACNMGTRPERYDNIGSHFVVMRNGIVLWMHDLDRIMIHGNGWNNQTVGIEIDGLYEGELGNIKTLWDDPTTPQREQPLPITPESVEATKQLIRWLKAYPGTNIGVLVAHRQSSAQRQDDPGSGLWQQIALPMHKELGLNDGGVGFKIGDGYPIPESWDPRCKGIKY